MQAEIETSAAWLSEKFSTKLTEKERAAFHFPLSGASTARTRYEQL